MPPSAMLNVCGLADSGISYFFEYDEENNCDVMVLADHSYAWPEAVAIPFRHPAGLFDGGLESVWEMNELENVAIELIKGL